MTRHDPRYTPPPDDFVPWRCPTCRHLRYADESPGDPCRFSAGSDKDPSERCGCEDHHTPGERIECE